MSYTAEIVTTEDVEELFRAEDKDFKNDRSSYEVEQRGGEVVFRVSADDATALRATLDSICKGLKVYEKMKGIK